MKDKDSRPKRKDADNRRPRQSQRLAHAASGKPQCGDAPHLDFLISSVGSFREPVTEAELPILNAGLAILFTRLREARQEYDEVPDGGRQAALTAVAALLHFVMLFDAQSNKPLSTPIQTLLEALSGLKQNIVKPIVEPIPRRGRAPSSQAYQSIVGLADGTVSRLRKTGLTPDKACDVVAKVLTKLGVRSGRGPGNIEKGTVRHWCDEVASDVGRKKTEAMVFDSMFVAQEEDRFLALTPDRARKFARDSLEIYVREISPELRQPGRKPSCPPDLALRHRP